MIDPTHPDNITCGQPGDPIQCAHYTDVDPWELSCWDCGAVIEGGILDAVAVLRPADARAEFLPTLVCHGCAA